MKALINIARLLFLSLFIWLMIKGKMVIWLGVFGVSLLMAPLFGRVFCGWICPMNTVMIPVAWISKRLNLQTKVVPAWLRLPVVPWIMLVVSLALMIILKRVGVDTPLLVYLLLLSVAVTLRYESEVFHNKLCPFGLLQSLSGQFARRTEYVSPAKCNGCKRCEKVCPSNAVTVSPDIRKATIDSGLCHQCFNCQSVCPKGAIAYGHTPVAEVSR